MKLLVTGDAGLIGRDSVPQTVLEYPADEVVVLDALTYVAVPGPLVGPFTVRSVPGDVAELGPRQRGRAR